MFGDLVSDFYLCILNFMKIITWNCNGAFRKKYHLIEKLGADILVVQECEDPSRVEGDYKDWAQNYLWIGANKNKGLGVFAKNHINLKRLDLNDDGLQLFLPCRINGSFNLIAVWTKQANSPNFRYIGQLWKYLQLHKDRIAADKVIICGDFNSNVQWDEWDRWWNHSDVVRELQDINIYSLYHELTGEKQGLESMPTLFMHRKLERAYHIDYAFASKRLFDLEINTIEIGKPEIWLEYSDHMPVVFTVSE
jgi:exonuclease III